jgi:hypothetical protein
MDGLGNFTNLVYSMLDEYFVEMLDGDVLEQVACDL